eukprot:GHVS01031898.1.p1 GENE.GHVS01031898.1~~GHVS01031898.1.p1  ORF type:complete len:245 (-),score=13.66 GHVS01031898.1:407-1141(-)
MTSSKDRAVFLSLGEQHVGGQCVYGELTLDVGGEWQPVAKGRLIEFGGESSFPTIFTLDNAAEPAETFKVSFTNLEHRYCWECSSWTNLSKLLVFAAFEKPEMKGLKDVTGLLEGFREENGSIIKVLETADSSVILKGIPDKLQTADGHTGPHTARVECRTSAGLSEVFNFDAASWTVLPNESRLWWQLLSNLFTSRTPPGVLTLEGYNIKDNKDRRAVAITFRDQKYYESWQLVPVQQNPARP